MWLLLSGVILMLLMVACKPKANLPNPTSDFCEENGEKLEMREDETGGQVGYCIFEDGSECEEWIYYRSDCKPGDSLSPGVGLDNPASLFCEENGGSLEIREDETVVYSLGTVSLKTVANVKNGLFAKANALIAIMNNLKLLITE